MIERYTVDDSDVDIWPAAAGKWVKYEDVEKAIKEAYANGVKAGLDEAKRTEEYWRTH